MIWALRRCATRALLLLAAGFVVGSLASRATHAQGVFLEGPSEILLPTVTPAFKLRAGGLGPARPLLIQLQISTTPDFVGLVLDSMLTSMDSVVSIQVTRPLPSETLVYWRARVRALAGPAYESAVTGPRTVPAWVTLVYPNSPTGNGIAVRRPRLIWSSPPVTPSAGPWRYDVELQEAGRPMLGVRGLTDTTFRPPTNLQANTSYRWTVRAWLPAGGAATASSLGSFVITDPPLPTTTLLYQNFPNPFPSTSSFNTCFWFDIGEGGASVTLDILDLRGNMVRRIIPSAGDVMKFDAGRYGRGMPESDSNCDGRFVWDGTASDGRTVAPGVYIARFRTDNDRSTFRRIVFRGR